MSSDMITVEQAAERLRMTPQTVRRWIRNGLLPASKLGGKEYRINPDDLADHLAAPGVTQVTRRTVAIEHILSLREKLRGRNVSLTELMTASRRDLEGYDATGRG